MKNILVLGFFLSSAIFAMPEESLNTRSQDKVIPLLESLSYSELKKELSKTDVPELDTLWDSRKDYRSAGCETKKSACQIVSRFEGKNSDRPLVLLPGFTGYRRLNVEMAYDLIQEGFGPVYILDFQGYGETIANSEPLADFVVTHGKKVAQALDTRLAEESFRNNHLQENLKQLPVGIAHIDDILEHVNDVNFVMDIASKENPSRKIVINAHSTGSMYLMLSLGQKSEKARWIKNVSRITLESPFLRGMGTDKMIPVPYSFPITETLVLALKPIMGPRSPVYATRSIPEFVMKATGTFTPGNSISHSPNRMSLTDNLRTWSGFETAGADWSWVKSSIDTHFDLLLPNAKFKKLNQRMKMIHKNLAENNIQLISVATDADTIANPKGTHLFLKKLRSLGKAQIFDCSFKTASHGLYVESDKYRDPFMEVIIDGKSGDVKAVYGNDEEHEALNCASL
jgi:alpha-beta hydrolase superfamily lysophospholipase